MTNVVHTASPNVFVWDDLFFIPQLNRTRRIWIYLPARYHASRKSYPVLYMHDGQNLFDNATSYSGEWEVDETLDNSDKACIVVGIDNGGSLRMNEYNPNDTVDNGKGEGLQYLDFIANTLKPLIDKKFRTLHSKKHTFIAGSSMGGLISLYAGIFYPKVFGRIGIFSPSLWIVPQLNIELKDLLKKKKHSKQRYYLYGGGAEHPKMIEDLQTVTELIRGHAGATAKLSTDPEGEHSEACWRKEFKIFYEWISAGNV